MRISRLRGSAAAVTILAGALAAAALTAPTVAGASGTTTVQVPQRLCSAPGLGHKSCDAVRLVKEQVSPTQAAQLRADGLARPAGIGPAFGPGGGYSPAQVAKAYGINVNGATTQTVAIVDAFDDPSVLADLNAFDANYGLPAETSTSFKLRNQTGGTTPPATTDVGWAGEITLDVQAVRGLCHKCKILLIEADSNQNADLADAVDEAVTLGAKIVSNSYGGPEAPADPNTGAYNHAGVAILASTGDDGWYGWDRINVSGSSDNVPSTPASYRTVIGVGGTSLYLNADNTRAAEQVWNDNGPNDVAGYSIGQTFGSTAGAAGSGCSTLYSPQLWQQKVAGYGGLGCGSTKRNGVDIAAIADYFTGYDIYQTTAWCVGTDGNGNTCPSSSPGWQTFGGTSLATPVVAAMWALAGGPAAVRYPALSLYGHFKSDTAHPLYDVTIGGTGACDTGTPTACAQFFSPPTFDPNPNDSLGQFVDCMWGATGASTLSNHYQCYARAGYDGVSGVGTPKNANVFKPMSPKAVIKSPGTVTHGVAHTFSAAGSASPFPGGKIVSYTWNWGDGHTTTTTSVTVSHKYASAGSRKITLTVTDNYKAQNGNRVGKRSLTITVH
jgi:hypothetical protein